MTKKLLSEDYYSEPNRLGNLVYCKQSEYISKEGMINEEQHLKAFMSLHGNVLSYDQSNVITAEYAHLLAAARRVHENI